MGRAKRRVVVTGLGLVTPVGADVESTWEAVRQGRGGVGPDQSVRRADVFNEDRRRGERLPAGAVPGR